MDFFEKLQQIRKYRHLHQKDIAEWLGVSQNSYSKKERGLEGGLKPQQIVALLQETQIDARWLLGQLEGPIEQADLRLHAPEKALTERLLEEIQELRKRTRPLKELDPLAERVVSDLELRRLVEKLLRRRAHFKRIEGYLEGLEEGLSESQERAEPKKENAAGA